MKKILVTLITIIATLNLVHAQADWINYKIDDKLSVKLPTYPKSIGSGVTAHSKDSLICYVSIVGEMDSTALAKLVLTQDFPNGLKAAMAGTQQGLTLGDMKVDKWNGYSCYNVDGSNPQNKLKVSFYLLVIGGRIYALGAMMPENHDINEKNVFFNTLRLN
jgi:hypothetical protein